MHRLKLSSFLNSSDNDERRPLHRVPQQVCPMRQRHPAAVGVGSHSARDPKSARLREARSKPRAQPTRAQPTGPIRQQIKDRSPSPTAPPSGARPEPRLEGSNHCGPRHHPHRPPAACRRDQTCIRRTPLNDALVSCPAPRWRDRREKAAIATADRRAIDSLPQRERQSRISNEQHAILLCPPAWPQSTPACDLGRYSSSSTS